MVSALQTLVGATSETPHQSQECRKVPPNELNQIETHKIKQKKTSHRVRNNLTERRATDWSINVFGFEVKIQRPKAYVEYQGNPSEPMPHQTNTKVIASLIKII